MKRFRIIDHLDSWLGNQVPTEENAVVDEAELARLAAGWGRPVEELMDDLEEVEEG